MRTHVRPAELVVVDGTPTTVPLRSLIDSARHADELSAVCLIESAVRNNLVTLPALRSRIAAIRGERGSVRAASALARVDVRSESPLETRARLLLVDAGLPAPRVQVAAAPGDPRRIDLAYFAPDHSAYQGLAIEIDGREVHAQAEAFDRDPIRQTQLEEAGWLFRRFTYRHLRNIGYVVGTVRRALARIGYVDE